MAVSKTNIMLLGREGYALSRHPDTLDSVPARFVVGIALTDGVIEYVHGAHTHDPSAPPDSVDSLTLRTPNAQRLQHFYREHFGRPGQAPGEELEFLAFIVGRSTLQPDLSECDPQMKPGEPYLAIDADGQPVQGLLGVSRFGHCLVTDPGHDQLPYIADTQDVMRLQAAAAICTILPRPYP